MLIKTTPRRYRTRLAIFPKKSHGFRIGQLGAGGVTGLSEGVTSIGSVGTGGSAGSFGSVGIGAGLGGATGASFGFAGAVVVACIIVLSMSEGLISSRLNLM